MKKKFFPSIVLLLFLILIFFNFDRLRIFTSSLISDSLKVKIYKTILGEKKFQEIQNLRETNYNVSLLPKSTYEFLRLDKINLDIDLRNYSHGRGGVIKTKKFFLENIGDKFLAISFNGKIMTIDQSSNPPFFKTLEIENNLDAKSIFSVMDIAKIGNDIFISTSSSSEKLLNDLDFSKDRTCQYLKVYKANFNEIKLNFKPFFQPDVCLKDVEGGRIQPYVFNDQKGILLTTSARNKPYSLGNSVNAQKDESPFGKILFFSINEKNENYIIISKGHRNPQGLLVHDNIILETEHGPKGGDEINKIVKGNNYGFPIVSVGDLYSFPKKDGSDYLFKKNHEKNNFEEPIFTFVPSIGIQQIIKVPESFSKYWKNNFLISSLNGKSLYRVEFKNNFNKIIYFEKIFIGERIRDIVFDKKNNQFLLAMENTGSIGILKSPQSFGY